MQYERWPNMLQTDRIYWKALGMKLVWEIENVYLVIAYSALRGVSLYQIAHLNYHFFPIRITFVLTTAV